jgi:hypothetical protein
MNHADAADALIRLRWSFPRRSAKLSFVSNLRIRSILRLVAKLRLVS